MQKYDVCVIGGGPAGYAATVRALDYGKRVLLVEKSRLGGAGIYDGALSSKTLWEIAKDVSHLHVTDRGYKVHGYDLDFKAIIRTMHEAEAERNEQMRYQLEVFEREIHAGRFVYKTGFASFDSPHEIRIESDEGVEIVWAEHVVLATGSIPRKLPHIPIDEKIIVTSDGIGNFDEFPESLVVLGAGVIGCEFATIFAAFGRTRVFIIDKSEQILPFEDEDLTCIVAENLEKSGVTIHRKSALRSMEIENGKVKYVLDYHDGRCETHYAEKALISIGRVANVAGLRLENAGVELDTRGNIVNDDSQTTAPHIYVVGDMTADICLVNVGELEGRHAIEKIYANVPAPVSYDNVSTIMFLSPEVAGVGMNEKQCRAAKMPYRVGVYRYEFISRSICQRNSKGFIKMIVSDDDEMRLMGIRAIGAHASSVIQASALLIRDKKGIAELAELVHPHPSITEGIQECARMLLGKSVFKPEVFKDRLRCCRVDENGTKTDLIYGRTLPVFDAC
jgi:dihydrolipoamide dehydrogenase